MCCGFAVRLTGGSVPDCHHGRCCGLPLEPAGGLGLRGVGSFHEQDWHAAGSPHHQPALGCFCQGQRAWRYHLRLCCQGVVLNCAGLGCWSIPDAHVATVPQPAHTDSCCAGAGCVRGMEDELAPAYGWRSPNERCAVTQQAHASSHPVAQIQHGAARVFVARVQRASAHIAGVASAVAVAQLWKCLGWVAHRHTQTSLQRSGAEGSAAALARAAAKHSAGGKVLC